VLVLRRTGPRCLLSLTTAAADGHIVSATPMLHFIQHRLHRPFMRHGSKLIKGEKLAQYDVFSIWCVHSGQRI